MLVAVQILGAGTIYSRPTSCAGVQGAAQKPTLARFVDGSTPLWLSPTGAPHPLPIIPLFIYFQPLMAALCHPWFIQLKRKCMSLLGLRQLTECAEYILCKVVGRWVTRGNDLRSISFSNENRRKANPIRPGTLDIRTARTDSATIFSIPSGYGG